MNAVYSITASKGEQGLCLTDLYGTERFLLEWVRFPFEFDYFKVADEIQISQLVEHFDKLFLEETEEAPSEDEISKPKRSTLA